MTAWSQGTTKRSGDTWNHSAKTTAAYPRSSEMANCTPIVKTKHRSFTTIFFSVFTKDNQHAGTLLEGLSLPLLAGLNISEKGVVKLLKEIDPSKAGGPDEVPCRILKELVEDIAPIMTDIYRQSLSTGVQPNIWKTAYISPIFKKGAVCEDENYHPVSLTCIPCKILEHIICSHLRRHLDVHSALSPQNHGFRKRHSCDTQLIITIQDLLTQEDLARSQVDVDVLDFAKVFDKVPHGPLLSKLRIYGIDEEVAQWIGAFLNDRTQAVIVDGSTSDQAQVHSGVLQGTVLGPLLFFLFISDLPSVMDPRTEVRLFVDDCLIYWSIKTTQDQIQFQEDLDAQHRWGQSWGMRFNTKKCNIMTITNKEDPLTKFYQFDNTILQQVDCATYLGILIHQSLKFLEHIRATATKCSQRLGFLQRNLKCPKELRKTAYLNPLHSCSEYGAMIWDPHLAKDKEALEKTQNRAIHWVSGLCPREPTSITKLCKDLKWLTLEQRWQDIRLTYIYKIMNNEVAISREDLRLEKRDSCTRATSSSLESSQHRKTNLRTPSSTEQFHSGIVSPPLWRRTTL